MTGPIQPPGNSGPPGGPAGPPDGAPDGIAEGGSPDAPEDRAELAGGVSGEGAQGSAGIDASGVEGAGSAAATGVGEGDGTGELAPADSGLVEDLVAQALESPLAQGLGEHARRELEGFLTEALAEDPTLQALLTKLER